MGSYPTDGVAPSDDPLHPIALFSAPRGVHVESQAFEDAIFTVDSDLVIHGMNHAAERLYGLTQEYARGKVIGTLLANGAFREEIHAYLHRVLAGEDVPPFEATRHRGIDDEKFHVLISASPLVSDEGEIVGVAMFSRPIDDLVLVRQALEIENERFAVAASVGGVGTWEVDLDAGTLTGSPEYYRMNLELGDVVPASREWKLSNFDEESQQRLRAFLDSDETELVHEYQLVGDDGDIRRIEVAGRKIPGLPGKRGRIIGVSWDITDDRRAEQRLAEMTARFQSVFDNSVEPMAIMDGNTWILMANDAHCELLGYSREELIGTDLTLISIEENRELDADNTALLRNGQIPEAVEQCVRRKDGSLIWVTSTISELRAPSADDPGEFLIQLRDITQERETADQLRHLAEHDPLTGLLNRRAFDMALKSHVDDTARGNRPPTGALLLLDLDHFKLHNDRYGHAAGDAVLVAVAEIMTQRLRGGDAIGRLGGDEFAVLLPDVDASEAQAIAADLVQLIGTRMKELAPDAVLPVTASVGVTDFSDRPDTEQVLRRADNALYEAKGEGRDRWSYRAS